MREKENIRRFLRPTAAKLALFAAACVVAALSIRFTVVFDAVLMVGFPLGFYPVGLPGWLVLGTPPPGVSWGSLAFDLAFWYAGACGVAAVLRTRAR